MTLTTLFKALIFTGFTLMVGGVVLGMSLDNEALGAVLCWLALPCFYLAHRIETITHR